MKKFIKQIRRLMLIIAIFLRCCFTIFKNLILLNKHKISKLEFNCNMCDIIYDSVSKACWYDLIDVDEMFDLQYKISDIEINVLNA